jgi:hypothetical protein
MWLGSIKDSVKKEYLYDIWQAKALVLLFFMNLFLFAFNLLISLYDGKSATTNSYNVVSLILLFISFFACIVIAARYFYWQKKVTKETTA